MDKIEVAKGVAEELWATERAIDAAIAQGGDFVATMIQARRDLNLAAVVGADAQTKVIEALGALAQARAAVVAAHADLAVAQRRLGIDVTSHGGPLGKPDDGASTPPSGRLEARRLRVAS